MRTRIAAGVLATAALVGTLGLGATQATAVPAEAPQQVAAQENAADAPSGWILRGKYVTRGGCIEAGEDGKRRQAWDDYQCANGQFFWNLWTNR
jgi:hypothetical protein